ncbi:hypothetical protein ILYODFUR_034251 [Ilyodon furcidens]|uniref:Uncharacterized protein n=1 Tax=Ilyodon furcidens TaxID=33524 RepID=A0ABV0TDE8_9TELE
MGKNPCYLPESEEHYTGLMLRAYLMQTEEEKAGAKSPTPPGEDKVDKEGTNVPWTGLGKAAWVVGLIGLCVMTSYSGAAKKETDGGKVQTLTFVYIFSVFCK